VQRQQLKWFAYAALLAAASWVFLGSTGLDERLGGLLLLICTLISLWTIPAAIAIAILRYQLYDIDRLINRTLVFGLLTALLGAFYASAVLFLGQLFGGLGGAPPSWAVAAATLAVAALFQPARRRVQHAVDRRFNRRRYGAAKTVEAFVVARQSFRRLWAPHSSFPSAAQARSPLAPLPVLPANRCPLDAGDLGGSYLEAISTPAAAPTAKARAATGCPTQPAGRRTGDARETSARRRAGAPTGPGQGAGVRLATSAPGRPGRCAASRRGWARTNSQPPPLTWSPWRNSPLSFTLVVAAAGG
jgi:hypothetical protein